MNAAHPNQIPATRLKPGTALAVQSDIFGVMHWGIVGYGHDSQGNPFVWHSQKADSLRATPFLEFSGGQSPQIQWIPQNDPQARRVIQKLSSKEGLPWHLTKANCEMVVRWAIEDKPISHQLVFGAVLAVAVAAVVVATASGD